MTEFKMITVFYMLDKHHIVSFSPYKEIGENHCSKLTYLPFDP